MLEFPADLRFCAEHFGRKIFYLNDVAWNEMDIAVDVRDHE